MSSKDMDPVSSHRLDTNFYGFNSQLLFPDNDALRFNCGRRDPGPKTRELSGFIDDKMFGGGVVVDHRAQMYFQSSQQQQMSDYRRSVYAGNGQQSGSDESEEEDGTDELDDDEGSSMDAIAKDGNTVQSLNNTKESPDENHQQVRATHYQNANGESDGDMYYSQFVHETNGAGQGKRDRVLEDGRKVASFFNESGNSLKEILSDPISGALMDDAVILPCGHSFGGGGIRHVLKMKACYSCSQHISEESVQPNLSLRSAVLAFRREEEVRSQHSIQRRKKKFEDKGTYGNSSFVETSRGRGVQFPFVVTDRVVIKVCSKDVGQRRERKIAVSFTCKGG